jgi:hypothetical protein
MMVNRLTLMVKPKKSFTEVIAEGVITTITSFISNAVKTQFY